MAEHAKLSASGAALWLHCAASYRLGQQFTDSGSSYAEAGTMAHSIAEQKALGYFAGRDVDGQLAELRGLPGYDAGMEDATDEYLQTLQAIDSRHEGRPVVLLEHRLDLSAWVPEGFGTADAILYFPKSSVLYIVDYKNGSGVDVAAENNPQLSLYALGALAYLRPVYGTPGGVGLVIVQPHAGGVKEWHTTPAALESWGADVVQPAARAAMDGAGEAVPGPWCSKGFCKARGACVARARSMLQLEDAAKVEPGLLSPEELADALQRSADLAAWASDLKEHAQREAMAGHAVPGFKLVAGRTSRSWAGGADGAFQALRQRGIDDAILWERKPVTPAALEKALGKAAFSEAADGLVDKTPGKPTLVPASDRRAEWTPAAAFQKIRD